MCAGKKPERKKTTGNKSVFYDVRELYFEDHF